MPTWKLILEYDGSRYSGWQQQKHARTVQGELLKAASALFSGSIDLTGAGRTDAGVHALAQVAHLRANQSFGLQKLQFGLNDRLPPDINILQIEPAKPNFNARHDAIRRFYLYQISIRRTAFGKAYVWWIKDNLNLALMQQASQKILGLRDFRSFSEPAETSPLVKVDHIELIKADSLLLFRIGASHFLWKMVRRLVGALVEVGRGNLALQQFEQFFQHYSNQPAAWTAPPSGLFLEKVIYSGDEKLPALKPAFGIA